MKLAAFQAAQTYANAKTAIKTNTANASAAKPEAQGAGENGAFSAVNKMAASVAEGEKAALAYMNGGADPHSVVEAMAAAEMAVQTAVTVRDKVVEAYQELIRMPI